MNLKYYLRLNLKRAVIGSSISGITVGAQTLQTLIIANLINLLVSKNYQEFWLWLGFDVAFQGLRSINTAIDGYYGEKLKQSVDYSIRRDLGKGIARFNHMQFHAQPAGNYATWFDANVDQINLRGVQTFEDSVTYSFGVIFPLISLTLYHWSFAVSTLLISGIMFIVPKLSSPRVTAASVRATKSQIRYTNQIINILGGFDVFESFKRLAHFSRQVDDESQKLYGTKTNFSKVRQLSQMYNGEMVSLANLAIMAQAAFLIFRHQISIGAFISTGSLAGMLMMSFGAVANTIVDQNALKPVFDVIPFTPPVPEVATADFADSDFAELRLSKVALAVKQQNIFKPVSAVIRKGDKVRIAGPSGSGKTTLASIIAGFQPATTGSAVVTGSEQGVKLSELVLYVPQAPYILNQSVRDNLTLGREFPDEKLYAILEEVGLADTILKLPDKIDTLIGSNDAVLSGGERQRLALARALLVKAPIIILDESTSNVDEQTAIQIDRLFLDDPQKTVFYISHESSNEYYREKFDTTIDLENPI